MLTAVVMVPGAPPASGSAQFKPAPEVSPAQLLRVRKQLKLTAARRVLCLI